MLVGSAASLVRHDDTCPTVCIIRACSRGIQQHLAQSGLFVLQLGQPRHHMTILNCETVAATAHRHLLLCKLYLMVVLELTDGAELLRAGRL